MKIYRWIMRGSYYERICRAALIWVPIACVAAVILKTLPY